MTAPLPVHRCRNTEVQHALSCMAKNNSLYLVANIGDSQPCHRLVSARCNHNVQGTNEHFQYNTDVAFDPEGKLVARRVGVACVCVCVCVCVYGYVCLQCVYLCVSCVCALAVGQALFKYASFSKNNCRQKRESSVTLSEPLNTSRGKQTNATVLVINMCGSYISTSSLLCLSTCYCTSVPLLKTDCGQHSTTCEEEEKKRKKEKQKNKHIIYCLI